MLRRLPTSATLCFLQIFSTPFKNFRSRKAILLLSKLLVKIYMISVEINIRWEIKIEIVEMQIYLVF